VIESEKILQRFTFSQQLMENLISDLLDLAKLENNQFSLSNDYFNLSNTIYEAFQMLQFVATEKEIELKAEIDKKIHLNLIQSIHGDQRRYLQILLNFLSNALKFTDRGGCITIKVDIIDHQLMNQDLSAKA
jgi:signal transduction histidine kinase